MLAFLAVTTNHYCFMFIIRLLDAIDARLLDWFGNAPRRKVSFPKYSSVESLKCVQSPDRSARLFSKESVSKFPPPRANNLNFGIGNWNWNWNWTLDGANRIVHRRTTFVLVCIDTNMRMDEHADDQVV